MLRLQHYRPELALPNLQLGAHGPGRLRLVEAAPGHLARYFDALRIDHILGFSERGAGSGDIIR